MALPLDMPEWKKNQGHRTCSAESFRVEEESQRTTHGGSPVHLASHDEPLVLYIVMMLYHLKQKDNTHKNS